MREKTIVKTIAAVSIFFALAFAVKAQTSNRYGGSFAKGVELFYAEDYAGAANEFEKAEAQNPGNHAAYIWHGIAYAALGQFDTKAANIWIKMPYDEKWKSLSRFLMGLGYWQAGETNNAKYWLNEAIKHPETPAAKMAQMALQAVLEGEDEDAPPIVTWATIANLPGAKTMSELEGDEENEAPTGTTSNSTQKNAPEPQTNGNSSGAKPSGGLWRATISNGYKGQTLSFRVSADGRTISNVQFQGYLQCTGMRTESTQLAPLKNITIISGAFEANEVNKPSQSKFSGTFTSASTANGTIRNIVYFGPGDSCDTYELKWTASRVGN